MRTFWLSVALLFVLADRAPAQYAPGNYYSRSAGMAPAEAAAVAEYWVHSYFRRFPDRREVSYWSERLTRQQPAQVLAELLGSDEYYDYAGGTPRGYARQLIADVGHHEASRYELEDLVYSARGANRQQLAFSMLRRYPGNWWPGPAARPPKELAHLYGRNYGGPNGSYGWR